MTSIVLSTGQKHLAKKKQRKRKRRWSSGRKEGTGTRCRTRRTMQSIFEELGPYVVRRMYRMDESSFWSLLNTIGPLMKNDRLRKRGKTPNGPILKSVRLGMALRYFAGGCPYDIALAHGTSHGEVLKSVWDVVDAVNNTRELNITFPTTYDEQRKVAEGFRQKSKAGFNNCVGAVDGILIWIHKPSDDDIEDNIGFGAKKFFCGRKKKFGLNMQGTCDARGRFLDIDIGFPGSASDFIVFLQSNLRTKVETPGFLAEGLALYGDNAYVNTPYMVVPFKSVGSGPKDAFNFYHSSLRINIECAFGMLVHRWGMLRKPIAQNIAIKHATSLVMCLCKLHNFCIDAADGNLTGFSESDIAHIVNEGGFAPSRIFDESTEGDQSWDYNSEEDRINDLLDGGEHYEDSQAERTRLIRLHEASAIAMPYQKMLEHIRRNAFQRPVPPLN